MLSALIWLPVLGAIAISILPEGKQSGRFRAVALSVTSALLIWTLVLGSQFDLTQLDTQFLEYVPWVEWIGLNYHLGVDGLSFPLLVLNGLLTVIAVYTSDR
ncbi:MAG: NAD(P)H-quinone oxidoreductase subunit D4, partial [Cyanobacteriota bacterium]